jgi:hypothetical protein
MSFSAAQTGFVPRLTRSPRHGAGLGNQFGQRRVGPSNSWSDPRSWERSLLASWVRKFLLFTHGGAEVL